MTGDTSYQHFNHDQNMSPGNLVKTGDSGSFCDAQPGSTMSSESGSGSNSPELVMSGGVPNPFSIPSPKGQEHTMTTVNWANHSQNAPLPHPAPSAPIPVPNPFSSGVTVPIAAARRDAQQLYPSAAATQQQQQQQQQQQEPTSPSSGAESAANQSNTGLNVRRQKRLERNRESARLSRRRRKQYLEVLEERVKTLSVEMDGGRRAHVAIAVDTVKDARNRALASGDEMSVQAVKQHLSGASKEFRVASTFQTQQLRSLSMPPSMKFILWLSLQNDAYFRGGRAASERLSAARIGERMLKNGNDQVPPAHGMWPLFCNEVGLSYDQEERVRGFQKTLLLTPESWVERHTAKSSVLALQSMHDCGQAVSSSVSNRRAGTFQTLSNEQLVKFLSWSDKNSDRIKKSIDEWEKPMRASLIKKEQEEQKYVLSDGNPVAANLYILNHRLQNIIKSLPKTAPMLNAPSLKRLTRRPSFESLGSMALDKGIEGGLSREASFPSNGSLKRCASEMSLGDEERAQTVSVPAEEAEAAALPTVNAALGFVRDIIPAPLPQPVAASPQPAFTLPPPPAPKVVVHQHHIPMPTPVAPAPANAATHILPSNAVHMITPNNSGIMPPQYHPVPVANNMHHQHQPQQVHHQQQPQQQHQMGHLSNIPVGGSFLPPHLQIVSEEGFIPGSAEDFLFDLAEEDWAIGEGFADAMET